MKTFKCDCQNHQILFFESKFCISCNQVVGIDDDFNKVEPYSFDTNNGYYFKADKPTIYYKKCDNNTNYEICNGMVKVDINNSNSSDNNETLCFACRFNKTVPNLSIDEHIPLWKKMEEAKRRAIFTLKALALPLDNFNQNEQSGLSFDFVTDKNVKDHFLSKLDSKEAVFTGHDSGHITINLAEADEVARSHAKLTMGENYRTLLGHFRHELGYYYFEKLILNSQENHELCKNYFGDDDLDYQEAMSKYYQQGVPQNWSENFISEYATMHPYEDWAETWAHYMHIIDTLETAKNFNITGSLATQEADIGMQRIQNLFSFETPINNILDKWMNFSIILNSLNRSMGMNDAYPFVLTQSVRTKLSFVHHAIHNKLDKMKN